MSVKKTDRILNELRINCDHDAANLIEQLQQRVVELERERDELSAHVERCNVDTDKAVELLSLIREGGFNLDELEEPVHDFLIKYQFANTPQASLAEHDAEVMAKSIEDFADSFNGDKSEWVTYQAFKSSAYQYANKIRNGEDGE